MELLIENLTTYFAIDDEDKDLRIEKLIELLDKPLDDGKEQIGNDLFDVRTTIADYIDEDIVTLLLDENVQVEENFIDNIIENYLDIIENTLQDVLNSLESSNEYIEYLVYDRPNEPVDSYYELIDTSVDIDEITIE